MANLVNFRRFLADMAAGEGGIPKVCLKGDNDLALTLGKLITIDNRKEDETDSQVAERYVDEICASLANPDNAEIATALNNVVTCFKEKLAAAIASVKDIREQAKTLAADMDRLSQDYLAGDPFVSKHLKLTTLSTDFPVWDWSGSLLVGAPTYIANKINARFAASEETVSEDFDYKNLTNSAMYIRKENPIKVVDGITAEEIDTIVNTLSDVLPEDTSVESIKEVVEVILGAKLINSLYSQIEGIAHLDPAFQFKTVQDFDGYIRKFYPVVAAIKDGTVAVPDAYQDTIKANVASLETLCVHFAYYELMERRSVMRQSILLQGGLVNGDEKSAYEEAGGTQLMLAHYIRFMYNDDVSKIPARGIPSKVIIESAAHNEKVVTESMANVANRIAVATTKAHKHAFQTVAAKYLVQLVDRTIGESANSVDRSMMISKLEKLALVPVADSILQYDIGFVDAAISLIIKAEFSGTFVEKLQQELGAKYLATVNAAKGEDVNELDFKIAEMDVVAKMVAEFVVEHLLGVCDCKDQTITAPVVPSQED